MLTSGLVYKSMSECDDVCERIRLQKAFLSTLDKTVC